MTPHTAICGDGRELVIGGVVYLWPTHSAVCGVFEELVTFESRRTVFSFYRLSEEGSGVSWSPLGLEATDKTVVL